MSLELSFQPAGAWRRYPEAETNLERIQSNAVCLGGQREGFADANDKKIANFSAFTIPSRIQSFTA